ncbi:Lsr2 family DNA-binding protein [Aeromicrobium phragmitis]|nr:histone-like nucleoid-structuring protein Lsr2 [Aeromicrobium phragmitis]
MRAWAKEQGIEVPARGRIPAEVLEKYNAAN